jgi:hypothetical protein
MALKIARWSLLIFVLIWIGILCFGFLGVGDPLLLLGLGGYASIGIVLSSLACVILQTISYCRRRLPSKS